MAMTQDKVNENLVKTIVEIIKSPSKKPHWEATKAPKAIKAFMSKPFLGKERKFKRMREWLPLLKVYFEAQAIALDGEKV